MDQIKEEMKIDSRHTKLGLNSSCIDGYQLLNKEKKGGGIPHTIGSGGSGIVYRARQYLYDTAYVDRAVKFFMYNDEILANDPGKKPISEGDFKSEIGNITSFNHESLIRVIGAGMHNCSAGETPYIIMDYIEGTTLKDIIEPQTKYDIAARDYITDDPDIMLDLLLEVAYAIKHMHDKNYAHCDIAPKNIFIKFDSDGIKPVVGDLGISKLFTNTSKRRTRIIGSRKWMPGKAEKFYDQEVDYDVFSSLQPYWDVYSFSKSGLKALEIFGGKEPRSWFGSLKQDFNKASDENNEWDINALIERLEFLKPIHREVAKVQELSMGVGSGRRKMMPVEALTTTKRLHNLVRHPALLRLSFVPQITTANQILPGANHTRYEHMLGVTETMRRYLISLLDESEFLKHLTTVKIEVALLATALSSATRFPLSNVIHELRSKDKGLFKDFSKHSLYLEVLRIEDNGGVALKDYIRSEFPNVKVSSLVSILCAEFDKFDDADHLIYSLLNNSLDVRVIDFVRRDAHHLGIISGDSFQIDEILPHVTIHQHKLALKIQGVSIAEQIILLRYWLFSRAYWNQPNRTFCAMVRTIFIKLHRQVGFVNDLRANILNFDQRGIIEFLREQSHKFELLEHVDLANRLLGREHTLFKILFEAVKIDETLGDHFNKLQNLNVSD